MAISAGQSEHVATAFAPTAERMRQFIDSFYSENSSILCETEGHLSLAGDHSQEAVRELRSFQRTYLVALLGSEVPDKLWRQRAEQIVQLQLRHGFSLERVAQHHRLFLQHAISYLNAQMSSPSENRETSLWITDRLLQDLSLQSVFYSAVLDARQHLSELPARLDNLLLTVPTVAALYSRLTEFLLQVPGIAGVWLGSPDEQDIVQYHFTAGEGVAEYLSGGPISLRDHPDNPIAVACTTGQPQFFADWADPKVFRSLFWRERGVRFGWRSSCAIPVLVNDHDRDVLTLYSKQVNFFAQEGIHRLILHLHGLLGFALERLRLMESLEQQQRTLTLYKAAMDACSNGITIAHASGEEHSICYVNPAFERITGYSAREILGQSGSMLLGEDRAQPQLELLREAERAGKTCTIELKNYRKDGTVFWNSLGWAPVQDHSGKVTHFIGIQNDITELKTSNASFIRANTLYRALMGTAELVIRAKSERELLDEFCRMLVESGLFRHVWIGRPNNVGDIEVLSLFSNLHSTEYWYRPNVHTGDEERIMSVRAWRRSALQYSNDRMAEPEYPLIHDFYRRYGLHATAVVPLYRDGDIWALLTLISDETNIFSPELVELLERIGKLLGHGIDLLDLRAILEDERQHQAWLARHDALTDILNRRGLTERLDDALARARRHKRMLAVAVMDLDSFKVVNDLHGHPVGDLLLRTVAERLQTTLRQTDAVGRLGGDEFVLILEDLEQEGDLAVTLSRVLAAVQNPIHLANGRTLSVRSSIGVTMFPQDDAPPERLLRHADRALYTLKENKSESTQRWMLFQAEADEKKIVHQKTIISLFRAGMVRVHYQPIIDLQTGRVTGVEALARMVEKDNALLFPSDFLPELSAADLVSLTTMVLSQSVKDLQRADSAGYVLHVGINFEPSTLADAKAMSHLRQEIANSGLEPSRIILELLERADTLSVAGSQQALRDLKTCGARIALDDVGSAYSSLLRVKELPVDIIKLDRSFLIGLEHHPKELRFLMNMAHLAKALGLELVAEGIESAPSADALAALGVHHAQGYWIARPMPIDELLLWLERHVPEAWTHPTSALGEVALQLRNLDATGRIMEQRPSFLQHLVSGNAALDGNARILERPALGGKLALAYEKWHAAMAKLAAEPEGHARTRAFQAARALYEEEMFDAALAAEMYPE
ncbi:MAG TPA: EAL domain-containing protein [Acidobacteriaceae bacterium]|nr:EAL domain-containing protein [Acidobacteriaceae bacterium]